MCSPIELIEIEFSSGVRLVIAFLKLCVTIMKRTKPAPTRHVIAEAISFPIFNLSSFSLFALVSNIENTKSTTIPPAYTIICTEPRKVYPNRKYIPAVPNKVKNKNIAERIILFVVTVNTESTRIAKAIT